MIKNKILLIIDEEIVHYLNEIRSENIFKRLMFLIYDIINEKFILKIKKEKELDIDKFIRNIIFSACNLALKVIYIIIFN